jgi:hypothetical protein
VGRIRLIPGRFFFARSAHKNEPRENAKKMRYSTAFMYSNAMDNGMDNARINDLEPSEREKAKAAFSHANALLVLSILLAFVVYLLYGIVSMGAHAVAKHVRKGAGEVIKRVHEYKRT